MSAENQQASALKKTPPPVRPPPPVPQEPVADESRPVGESPVDQERVGDPESTAGRYRGVVCDVLKAAGFTVTNQNMTFVDRAKLDRSKALESFKKLMDQRLMDTKDMDMLALQATMRERIEAIDFEKWSAKFGIVEGCAGSGKTTALLKCKEALGARALVITHSTEQLVRAFHGVSAVYTPLDVLTREENFSEPHVLLVDEYTKLHMCEIICCAAYLACRNVFLFGDAKQGLSHGLGSEKHYSFSIIAKSDTCHRLPAAGRDFLNECTGRDVKGGANKEVGEVQKGDIYQEIPDGAVILSFTQQSTKFLQGTFGTVILVSDAQGATYEDVALFIFERDLNAMQDPNLLEVALTRQRRKLVLCFESRELFAKLVNRMVNNCCKHQSTAQI